MVRDDLFELFTQDNVDKQAKIEYSGGVMTNKELFQNSEVLTETLCSEKELRFGSCESSTFKFKVANIVKPLIGEWITFSIIPDHHDSEPLKIGRYKVVSDKPTADRKHREVTAYDAMYDILNADVVEWYNSILPEKDSTITLKQFRQSFLQHFGISEYVPAGGLVNDSMIVERTIEPEQMSGKDVITTICEINGCFGHIGRDGKFHYIYLPQAIEGLYPADDLFPDHAPEHMVQAKTGHLYPQDPASTRIGVGTYIKCTYEDFVTKRITKLQIRQEENDIGVIYGEENGDNCYIIEDNFLVYGKSSEQLRTIAANIFKKITDIVYRPFDANCVGNPCLEVGDPVCFPTRYEIVESYILERTMKGIQALRDDYSAKGSEKYVEEVNGMHKSILQLKGKSNILERTIEETRLQMIDMGAGLSTEISVTAGQIRAELENTEKGLSNQITVTAGEIRGELKDTKQGLETEISVTASGIRADVEKTYETKTDASAEYTSIRSSISVESGRIASEIERATKAEQTLSGQIITTETNLTTKIEQTEKSINLSVSQSTAETKSYVDEQTAAAQNAANDATDNKLKNYSTTVEMNSAINLKANEISLSVQETYETKTDASTARQSLQSQITQNAGNISLKVSQSDYNGNYIASLINQSADNVEIQANHINLNGAITANEYFKINTDGSFHANYGMIGGFYVADGFLEANYTEPFSRTRYSLILYPPNNENFSLDNPAIQIREKIQFTSYEGYRYPFYVTYGGEVHADNANMYGTFQGRGDDGNVVLDDGKLKFFYSGREFYTGDISPCAFDSDHSGIKIMNSVEYQFGGIGIYAGSDNGLKYLMNDGWAPNGINERHIFWDDVRIMGTLYDSSATVITSDERVKNSVLELNEYDAVEFLSRLAPCEFKYNDGTSGRMHHGLIASQVKDAMQGEDWGVYVECKNEEKTQGIRYEELIPDLIAGFKNLNRRIAEIEGGYYE